MGPTSRLLPNNKPQVVVLLYQNTGRRGVAFSLSVQYGKQRAFLLLRHSGLPLGPALRSISVQGGANPADGDRDLTSTSAST
jgi:hypothetical protein